MVHVKDNVRQHLSAIRMATGLQKNVVLRLFGCSGVVESADASGEDDRTAELMQFVRQQNVDAIDYLQQHVLPKIKNNNRIKWRQSWIGVNQWTNNNCESMNRLLKIEVICLALLFSNQLRANGNCVLCTYSVCVCTYMFMLMQVDWKPKKVTDLVDHLRSVVTQPYTELRHSLAGLGNFQLTPAFTSKHLSTQMQWNAMSNKCKDTAFTRFMSDTGIRQFTDM